MIFVLLNTIFQIIGMDSVDVPQIIRQFTQSQCEIIIDHFSHLNTILFVRYSRLIRIPSFQFPADPKHKNRNMMTNK